MLAETERIVRSRYGGDLPNIQRLFMSESVESKPPDPAAPKICLARSVARALAEDPTLEAVTIDRSRRVVSVATIGRVDQAQLDQRITASLQAATTVPADQACALLTGPRTVALVT